MDVKKLRRDPEAVAKTLVETPESTATKTGCVIHIPSRFLDKGLASIGNETYIFGVFAIIVNESFYAITQAPALVRISPLESKRVMVDDDEYMEFHFAPGSVIIPNKDVVLQDTINYNMFDYFVDDGRIPWYVGYDDALKLWRDGKTFTGVDIAPNDAVISMLISIIFRDSRDRHRFYRHAVKTQADKEKIPPATVAFHSVLFGPRSTMTKLTGAYFNDGLVSSLVNPTDKVDPIERAIRL